MCICNVLWLWQQLKEELVLYTVFGNSLFKEIIMLNYVYVKALLWVLYEK